MVAPETKRIALLSDIHGNLIALEAVLDHIEAQGGVDEYWFVGDLAALGPQPVEVLARLDSLPNTRYVRGNTDRYVTTGDRPPPYPDEVLADPSQMQTLLEVAHSFAWTQGIVASQGWLPFMDDLPVEQRTTLPDGTRLLAVHASPGKDDGRGVRGDSTEAELQQLLAGCEADLVCVGHTHFPTNRQVGDVHLINLGSVSNPIISSLMASYVILEAGQTAYQIAHNLVDYDRETVITQLEELRHPGGAFIIKHFRGEFVKPAWGEPKI